LTPRQGSDDRVAFRREKSEPHGSSCGGNGGRGSDVQVLADWRNAKRAGRAGKYMVS